MGYWTGRVSFTVSGATAFLTGLSGAPTGCRLTISGGSSDTVNHFSVGTFDGTRQNVQYTSPTSSGSTNADIGWVKDASGTTQIRLSATGFGTSGGSGTVSVNVSTTGAGFQGTLEVWN